MGFLKAIGSDVPKFVNDVPKVPKCFPRWGSTPKHFLLGYKMKLWTIHVRMGVPEVIGSNVPNLIKDVPNLMKDVPRVPKCILRWGSAPKNILMGFKIKSWTIHVQIWVP